MRSLASMVRGAILIALLFASTSTLAQRKADGSGNSGHGGGGNSGSSQAGGGGNAYGRPAPSSHSVPEFGPAAAGVIGALVAGGGVLLARRRRR